MSNAATAIITIRHHWNKEGTHAPYQNIVHEAGTDEERGQLPQWMLELTDELEVEDGETIFITVQRGILPVVDRSRHMRRTADHHYEFVNGDSPERTTQQAGE